MRFLVKNTLLNNSHLERFTFFEATINLKKYFVFLFLWNVTNTFFPVIRTDARIESIKFEIFSKKNTLLNNSHLERKFRLYLISNESSQMPLFKAFLVILGLGC